MAEVEHPEVWPALEKLVDPITRCDQESPLRWTCKSTHSAVRGAVHAVHGFRLSHKTVSKLSATANLEASGSSGIENAEGRGSEGVIGEVGVGEDFVDEVAVVAQSASESGGESEDEASAPLDEGVGWVGGRVEPGVFGEEGLGRGARSAAEGEVDDDDLGGDEQSMELGGGHRDLRCGGGRLGLGGLGEDLEEELSSSRSELAVGGDSEELVAENSASTR